MSFAEKLLEAVRAAEAGAEPDPGQPFLGVLEQFVDTVGKLGVGARLDRFPDPRKVGVWLYPAHRPARGSYLLRFVFDGDAVIASGGAPTTIFEPADLEEWLLVFVKTPAFRESLDVLKEQATLPVEAKLWVQDDGLRDALDVLVAVTPVDQEVLDLAAPSAPVSLDVQRINFPGNPPFAAEPRYAVLDSAGLRVRITRCVANGAALTIEGARTA